LRARACLAKKFVERLAVMANNQCIDPDHYSLFVLEQGKLPPERMTASSVAESVPGKGKY
jgi:hypothetical protein